LAIRRCITVLAARATALAAAIAPALATVFIPCAGAFLAVWALAFAACILPVAAGQPSILTGFGAWPIARAATTALAPGAALATFPWWAVAWAAVLALGLRCIAVGFHAFASGRATGVACSAAAPAAAAIALSVPIAGFSGALACAVVLAWSALCAFFALGLGAFGNRCRCSRCRGGGVAAK
jgi:hypothetical protein